MNKMHDFTEVETNRFFKGTKTGNIYRFQNQDSKVKFVILPLLL